jgi:hypothetical protein
MSRLPHGWGRYDQRCQQSASIRRSESVPEPDLGGQRGVDGPSLEVKHGARIRFDNRPGSESVIDSPGFAFAASKAA